MEGYLTRRLDEELGLKCLKFLPDHRNGMPDRLVLLSGRRVVWVELKTKGGALSEIQKLRHKELRDSGQVVEVVWTKEQADDLVHRLAKEM